MNLNKRIFFLFSFSFIAFIFISGCLSPIQETPDIFPLKEGSSRTYKLYNPPIDDSGMQVLDSKLQIFKGEEINGKETFQLVQTVENQVTLRQWLAWGKSETGSDLLLLYAVESSGEKAVFDDPRPLLQLPLEEGNSWQFIAESETGGSTTSFEVIGMEELSLPAGTFNAVKVKSIQEIGEFSLITNQWFSPGIGLVKQEFYSIPEEYNFRSSMELVSYALN